MRKVQKKNHIFSVSKFLYNFDDTSIFEQTGKYYSYTFEQSQ